MQDSDISQDTINKWIDDGLTREQATTRYYALENTPLSELTRLPDNTEQDTVGNSGNDTN